MASTVQVPSDLFKRFLRAGKALSEFGDAFEDYLISTNPAMIKKLRRARRDHLAGRTRPFEELKRELGLD